eukprot:6203641-Pleurochrysis_carterae.AAC.4
MPVDCERALEGEASFFFSKEERRKQRLTPKTRLTTAGGVAAVCNISAHAPKRESTAVKRARWRACLRTERRTHRGHGRWSMHAVFARWQFLHACSLGVLAGSASADEGAPLELATAAPFKVAAGTVAVVAGAVKRGVDCVDEVAEDGGG